MLNPLANRPFRRNLTIGAAALLTTALTPLAARAQDATWNGTSGNFSNGLNWTPTAVPTNRATFKTSTFTNVQTLQNTTLNQIVFDLTAPSYSLTNSTTVTLTINGINGIGIDNQSSKTDGIVNFGTMTLNNASTRGSFAFVNGAVSGGDALLTLNGNSQLGAGTTYTANGQQVTVANGTFRGSDATTVFNDTSGADGIKLSQNGGDLIADGIGINPAIGKGGDAFLQFNDGSHADNATLNFSGGDATATPDTVPATATGGGSSVVFSDTARADNATINNVTGNVSIVGSTVSSATGSAGSGSASLLFSDGSHADGATINNFSLGGNASGGTGTVGSPGGNGTTGGFAVADGGTAGLSFDGSSHADNATITNGLNGVNASGGTGGAGDTGNGGTGGTAIGTTGTAFVAFGGDSHANGATINDLGGLNIAAGGLGGAGGSTGTGGAGGSASSKGGLVLGDFAGNAQVNGATINNQGGGAAAIGGTGGGGGSGAAGGRGGNSTSDGNNALLRFSGNATAGSGTTILNQGGNGLAQGGQGGNGGAGAGGTGGQGGNAAATGGNAQIEFIGNSSAGSAIITNTAGTASVTTGNGGNGNVGNGGDAGFASAVAGGATITFDQNSTAGNATIQNNRGAPFTTDFGTDGTSGGGGGSGGSAGVGSTTSTNATITFSGNATGGGARIENNGGGVTFNDATVFGTTGGALLVNQQAGLVEFNGTSSLGNGALTNGGATFGTVTFRDSSTAGSGVITNLAGGSMTFTDSSTAGAAAIDNSGGMTFDANSTLSSAAVTINGIGSLSFLGASDGVAGSVISTAGGRVFVSVNGFRLGSLSGIGSVDLGTNALQVGYLDRDDTFGGVIAGANGSLVKRGTGTFALAGENTYTGGTIVAAGTLQIGSGGTTGSIIGDVATLAGSTFAFNRSDTVTFGNVVSGGGALTQAGTGALILTNANTYTGGTTISGGSLQIGDGGTTGSIIGDVADNANLTFNRADNVNFANLISGTGSLTKEGTGVLVLIGANTYGGGTLIAAGTLQVGDGGTTGSIAGNVVDNAFLVFNRTDDVTFGGSIAGTGQLIKLAPGTLSLTGDTTLTGFVLIDAGTLQIGNGGTTGSITGPILDNANLTFNRSDAITYADTVSSIGTLTKLGAGTLALSGTNTYAGTTDVVDGVLNIRNGSALGSTVAGTIVRSGAALEIEGGAGVGNEALTLNGVGVGNGGALRNVSGNNSFAGPITLGTNTRVNSAAGLLLLSGLNGGGNELVVGGAGNVRFQGAIASLSSLTVDGTGIVALTGANTYTGATTVNSGVLMLANGAAIVDTGAVVVNAPGTLQVANAETIGSLAGSGTVGLYDGSILTVGGNGASTTFSGQIGNGNATGGGLAKIGVGTLTLTGANAYAGGTTITGGTLQIGSGGTTGSVAGNIVDNAALVFNRSDAITYAGIVSGTGTLTKAGAGTLILSGASTYTGATNVAAGTLELTGRITSPTTVAVGATLRGTGQIAGTLTNNGTLMAGNAVSPLGVISVTGNYTNAAGSTLLTTFAANGTAIGSASLVQAGSVTLSGGTVRPTFAAGGGLLMQTDFRIASGSSGLTGTFASLDTSFLSTGFQANLIYTANDAIVRVRRTATNFAQASGLTSNQQANAAAFDAAVTAGNPLVYTTYLDTYNSLLVTTNLPGALTIGSGDALTTISVAAQGAVDRFNDRLDDYTWSNSSNLWGTIAYGEERADGDGNGPGFTSNGVEAQIGFATSLGENTRLGIAGGYAKGDLTARGRVATADIDTYSIGARLRQDVGSVYLVGRLSYAWHRVNSTRAVLLGGDARARFNASTWTGSMEAGFVAKTGTYDVEPFVSYRYARTRQDAYGESGPAGALNVAESRYETTRIGGGIRLVNRDKDAAIKPMVIVRYDRELGDRGALLDNNLPGLPSFRVASTKLGADILTAELGLEARVGGGVSLFASGSGRWRDNDSSLQGNIGARFRF